MTHFIFVSEKHLRETLAECRVYYNEARPHQGIECIPRELDGQGVLGGLHHDYRLAA